ncbi:hypothetical protein G6F40_014890 [Rhizopus arrhizus]|nr:hypothetical protein G6F40_014890 [Rhizopus arrhizus]
MARPQQAARFAQGPIAPFAPEGPFLLQALIEHPAGQEHHALAKLDALPVKWLVVGAFKHQRATGLVFRCERHGKHVAVAEFARQLLMRAQLDRTALVLGQTQRRVLVDGLVHGFGNAAHQVHVLNQPAAVRQRIHLAAAILAKADADPIALQPVRAPRC